MWGGLGVVGLSANILGGLFRCGLGGFCVGLVWFG